MQLASYSGKVEMFGMLAVVLSLLFVAHEICHNTNTAADQAVFSLNEAGAQTLLLQVSDPEIAASKINPVLFPSNI